MTILLVQKRAHCHVHMYHISALGAPSSRYIIMTVAQDVMLMSGNNKPDDYRVCGQEINWKHTHFTTMPESTGGLVL